MKDYKRFIFFIIGFALFIYLLFCIIRIILEIRHRKNIKFEFNLERISQNMIYLTETIIPY